MEAVTTTCRGCAADIPYRGRGRPRTWCHACGAAKKRAWREANKGEIAAKQRAWREANKGEIAAKQRAWREANKGEIAAKQRAYYEANKGEIAAKKRAYYEANKGEIAAKKRAYYEANKGEIAAKQRAWKGLLCAVCDEQLRHQADDGLCGFCREELAEGVRVATA